MRALRLLLLLILAGFQGLSSMAMAHEVRPGYLVIEATEAGYRIVWKEPVIPGAPPLLSPSLSNGWLARPADRRVEAEGFTVSEWRIPVTSSIEGVTITIDGFNRSLSDALVRYSPVGGKPMTQMLRAGNASWTLPAADAQPGGLWGFVRLGISHILTGYDHLLFVSGLMLLVTGWRQLAATITAFTLGHSLTLCAAVLGLVRVNPGLVECLIALSVVILAVEVVMAERGRRTFAVRAPWVVALGFGLLHGLGFAGALTEAGLPQQAIAPALLGFNIGVEIGQLVFVAAVLVCLHLLRQLITMPRMAATAAGYAIGTLSAFWLFERISAYAV